MRGERKWEGSQPDSKQVSQSVFPSVGKYVSKKTVTPFNDLFIPSPITPMVGWGLGWVGVLVGVGVVVCVGVAGSWAAYPT